MVKGTQTLDNVAEQAFPSGLLTLPRRDSPVVLALLYPAPSWTRPARARHQEREPVGVSSTAPVRRKDMLGGLIHEYELAA